MQPNPIHTNIPSSETPTRAGGFRVVVAAVSTAGRHLTRAGGFRVVVAAVLTAGLTAGMALAGASAQQTTFADPAFERVWGRTDYLVLTGQVARSWYWGPEPNVAVLEIYDEGLNKVRQVQYFDKARMEINNPRGDQSSKWYVTNGLLAVELISGQVQYGDGRFESWESGPAQIPLASDLDDADAPTYASFTSLSNTPAGNHPALDRSGQLITQTVDRAGQVGNDRAKEGLDIRYGHYEPLTQHNIAAVFWTFLNASGPVREAGETVVQPLSDPWFFTSGLPISEPYWARARIDGQPTDVLIQAFERRVLTYIPDFPPDWRVQMGNIGYHYLIWRYPGGIPQPEPTAAAALDSLPAR